MRQHQSHKNRTIGVIFLAAAIVLGVQAGGSPASAETTPPTRIKVTNSTSSVDALPVAHTQDGTLLPWQRTLVWISHAPFPYTPAGVNVRVRWACGGVTVQNVAVTTAPDGTAELPYPSSFGIVPPSNCTVTMSVPWTGAHPQMGLYELGYQLPVPQTPFVVTHSSVMFRYS